MNRYFTMLTFILLSARVLMAEDAPATSPTTHAVAQVNVAVVTEDNQKQLQATITKDGKPVANATVGFYIRRTFGKLLVGEDHTLDDGTAATKFPKALPGDSAGKLSVIAVVSAPPELAGSTGEVVVDGGIIVKIPQDPFPRAFWAPHAPITLLVSVGVMLAGIWATYAYVVFQIIAIKRGAAGS